MLVFFEDIPVGTVMWSPEVVADADEMVDFGRRFDPWPMHVDPSATDNPFGGLIASGGYTIGLWYRAGHKEFGIDPNVGGTSRAVSTGMFGSSNQFGPEMSCGCGCKSPTPARATRLVVES